jgi:hypothetical protein
MFALDADDDEDAASSAATDVPSLLASVGEPDPLYVHMEERNMLAAQWQRIFNTLSKESLITMLDITLANAVSGGARGTGEALGLTSSSSRQCRLKPRWPLSICTTSSSNCKALTALRSTSFFCCQPTPPPRPGPSPLLRAACKHKGVTTTCNGWCLLP